VGMRRWNCTIVEIRATDPLISALYAVRHEVFVVEQGVPENFKSTRTTRSPLTLLHFLMAMSFGKPRIVHHERTAKVGRIDISASSPKKGIGRELMEFAAATA